MTATGNETLSYDQLSEYIKFASNEDAEAYFESGSGATGDEVLTVSQLRTLSPSGGSSGGGSQTLQQVTLFEGNKSNTYQGLFVDIGQPVTDFEYIDVSVTDSLGSSGGSGVTRIMITGSVSTVVEDGYITYPITFTAQGQRVTLTRDQYMGYLTVTKVVGYYYA